MSYTETSSEWGNRGRTKTVRMTGTIPAAGNYAANDVVSDSTSAGTAWDFAVAPRKGFAGYITYAQLLCSATSVASRFRLYLFKNTPTSNLNDNVANTAIAAADIDESVGYIDFPTTSSKGGYAESQVTIGDPTCPMKFNCDQDDDTLYGILVVLDAETNESASMTVQITLTAEVY